MTPTVISYTILFIGLFFWMWGTFPILNREHSIFYKLHTLTVSDSVGSLLILLSLIIRFPQYWHLLVVTALSLSLWNTISSYILANISDRRL
jgi:multicomponent Na+:H+ antiporter subunit G